ncbi:hypothetical protein ACFPJ4_01730 [Lysinimonas soli]|uniref:CcmD family protein n=1 Tax=Lysinimonas soli TaxID=1074233 RepID=A0ABW0NKQ5_9MICO
MIWRTFAHLVDATPSPSPSTVNDDLVTPGVWGFAITAIIMIAVILLIIDMVRRLRRVNYRAEIRARLEAEAAAGPDGTGAEATASGTPASPSPRAD